MASGFPIKIRMISMKKGKFSQFATSLFCCFLTVATSISNTSFAAREYGVERVRSCDASNGSVEDFQFLNFGVKETEFTMGNSYCFGWAIGIYALVKTDITAMNIACGTGNPIPRIQPTPLEDFKDIAAATKKAAIKIASRRFSDPCVVAVGAANASFAAAMTAFAILLGTAQSYYRSVSVCGADWEKPNPKTYLNDGDGYKKQVNDQVQAWIKTDSKDKLSMEEKTYREWVYGGVEFESDRCPDTTKPKANGRRGKQKYYFRGLAPANFRCEIYNPAYCNSITASKDECEKAYDCCLDTSENYICLSKNSMQIAGNADHIFCKAGSSCDMDRPTAANEFSRNVQAENDKLNIVPDYSTETAGLVKFEAYFRDNNRLICAKSYSLCPYNFSVGGGSIYADYFRDGEEANGIFTIYTPTTPATGASQIKNALSGISNKQTDATKKCDPKKTEIRDQNCRYNNKAGRIKNYCQFYTHCTIATEKPYMRDTSNLNSYFSRACLDFKGDAKNGLDFNGIPQFGKLANFSAPLAQCFKETLENVFFNRYGHSLCADGSIATNAKEECLIGIQDALGEQTNYMKIEQTEFKKGNKVEAESFFSKLQSKMRYLVQIVLSFSVCFFGFQILMGKVKFDKRKDIMVYLLKIAMVSYFALGDAWQSRFFDGIYGASTALSELVFKVRVDDKPNKRDGCQFGKVFNQKGIEVGNLMEYPKGKEYLMIWDSLDCKIMKFLGYGPSTSSASIATLIIASYFTGGIGLYFAMSILIFAMIYIALTIRAIQLFISVGLAIIIYVFVSPIIIPLVLFEKTKNIFESWLTQLIGFCFQPIVLFAYLGIFITLSEQSMVGTARYITSDQTSYNKDLDCSKYCRDSSGNEIACASGQSPNTDPYDTSMSCILDFKGFGKSAGFELLGIGLPSAAELLKSVDLKMITVLKCALLIFILAKFMDEIPGITSQLISSALPTSDANAKSMLDKTANLARNIQKRISRVVKAQAIKGGGKAGEAAQNLANKNGNSDKQQQPNENTSSISMDSSNGGSGGDIAADSSKESGGNSKQD